MEEQLIYIIMLASLGVLRDLEALMKKDGGVGLVLGA